MRRGQGNTYSLTRDGNPALYKCTLLNLLIIGHHDDILGDYSGIFFSGKVSVFRLVAKRLVGT